MLRLVYSVDRDVNPGKDKLQKAINIAKRYCRKDISFSIQENGDNLDVIVDSNNYSWSITYKPCHILQSVEFIAITIVDRFMVEYMESKLGITYRKRK